MSTKASELQREMHNLLTSNEQSEFLHLLNNYHSSRDVESLAWGLTQILDTPAKRSLINSLRNVLPKSQTSLFERCIRRNLDIVAHINSERNVHRANPNTGNAYHTLSVPPRRSKVFTHDGSTRSLPVHGYQTLPTRRHPSTPSLKATPKVIRRRPASDTEFNHARRDLSNWEAGIIVAGNEKRQHLTSEGGLVKTVYIEQSARHTVGLGFSIRGGAEHGIGVYVSYVEVDSVADRQGLVPGDQILSINGVLFDKITHEEAAKMIRHCSMLEMKVRNVGRVPGSFETHQRYMWVDANGRPTSPPPEVDRTGRYDASGERRSELMLLKDSDERKVNLVLDDTKTLGLKIRGGNEFGLGIYVTDVDPGSSAEKASIKVGDQILDVNGTSFLDISHAEAASVLKAFRHQMLTIKDVGKVPHTLTTIDQTQWIMGNQKSNSANVNTRNNALQQTPNGHGFNGKSRIRSESIFSRGVGSQLMHSAALSQKTQWAIVEERGRHLLSESERLTLSYYLGEYQQGNVKVDDLYLALCQLLNTPTKMQLMSEIRGVISPKDLEKFDHRISRQKSFRSSKRKKKTQTDKNDDLNLNLNSNGQSDVMETGRQQTLRASTPSEYDPLQLAIQQIGEAQEVEMNLAAEEEDSSPLSYTDRQRSHEKLIVADVHSPFSPHSMKPRPHEEVCSPSEDSGVEVNGHNGHDILHPTSQLPLDSMKTWGAISPITSPSNGNTRKRVTMSSQEPVIINDEFKRHQQSDDEDFQPPSRVSNKPSKLINDHRNRTPERKAWKESAMAKARKKSLQRGTNSGKSLKEIVHVNANPTRSEDAFEKDKIHVPMYATPSKAKARSRSRSPGTRMRRDADASVTSFDSPGRNFARSRSASGRLGLDDMLKLSFSSEQEPNHYDSLKGSENEIQSIQNLYPVHRNLESEVNQYLSDDALPQRLKHLKLTDIRLDSPSLSEVINTKSPVRSRSLIMQPPHISQTNDHGEKLPVYDHHTHEIADHSKSSRHDGSVSSDVARARADLSIRREVASHEQKKSVPPAKPPRKHKPFSAKTSVIKNERKPADDPPGKRGGVIKEVVVVKNKPTLGIAIEGGAYTRQPLPRVIQIHPSGSAASSDLGVGDILLEVNGIPLEGKEHSDCARTIAEAFKSRESSTILLQVMKKPKDNNMT